MSGVEYRIGASGVALSSLSVLYHPSCWRCAEILVLMVGWQRKSVGIERAGSIEHFEGDMEIQLRAEKAAEKVNGSDRQSALLK
jgi:hypothetical protein